MDKLQALQAQIRKLERVAVAFSSGVDSTFLLQVAHDVLGETCIAITAVGSAFSQAEQEEGRRFCKERGIRQISVTTHEMELEDYASNPPDRCYHCKKYIFTEMMEAAARAGYTNLLEGSNVDDLGDYRPGMRAITELGIRSPLKEVGLTKAEIRAYSKEMGLPTAEKPSFACLATRIPYGERITPEKLGMIEAAEAVLASMGLRQYRVRMHGSMARIEVPENGMDVVMEQANRQHINKRFHELGFTYVSLDLEGFRSGSMNEGIE